MEAEKREILFSLLGAELYPVWEALCAAIEEKYDMDRIWDKGYRDWVWEYKYRRGGKTLCTLYAKEKAIGLQIIFGRDERAKAEAKREEVSAEVYRVYEEAATFHDGKWVMFLPTDTAAISDYLKLLAVKRRPNRK